MESYASATDNTNRNVYGQSGSGTEMLQPDVATI